MLELCVCVVGGSAYMSVWDFLVLELCGWGECIYVCVFIRIAQKGSIWVREREKYVTKSCLSDHVSSSARDF